MCFRPFQRNLAHVSHAARPAFAECPPQFAPFDAPHKRKPINWGTSSFRLWVLRSDGSVVARTRKNCGMSTLHPDDFEARLEAVLRELHIGPQTPVVICGMGSAQSWIEAPYVTLPASTGRLAQHAVRVPSARRSIHFVPGLSQDPAVAADVMRGEETLLLGLWLVHNIEGCVCLPAPIPNGQSCKREPLQNATRQ